MAYDEAFYDGFDKYGEIGVGSLTALMVQGEWSSTANTGSATWSIVAALSGDGSGYAMQMSLANNPSSRMMSQTKIFSGNYARICGGVTFKNVSVTMNQPFGFIYGDGGTAQFSITLNGDLTISLRRGDDDGTIIATSTETAAVGAVHCLEWDVVPDGTAGTATIYMDGVPLTNLNGLTGLDLTNTANNYANRFWMQVDHGGTTSSTRTVAMDHMYHHLYLSASDPSAACLLTNPVIDTDYPVADSLLQFTPERGVLGEVTRYGTNVASPAANSLILRKFVQQGDGTLVTARMIPNATSAPAKFKGVLYADNGSGTAPAGLLDTGTEVTGCTTGVAIDSTMTNYALVDGTTYWLGFIMDTSLSLQLRDANAAGYRAANTYASGAPDPAPAMTSGQGSWYTFGLVVPPVEGWSQLTQNPPSSLSYNSGTGVGDTDLYEFSPLVVTPAQIHGIAIKPYLLRTDAGARTVSTVCESNGAEDVTAPAAPATTGQYIPGYFEMNPDTGLPWTATELAAMTGGYRIET